MHICVAQLRQFSTHGFHLGSNLSQNTVFSFPSTPSCCCLLRKWCKIVQQKAHRCYISVTLKGSLASAKRCSTFLFIAEELLSLCSGVTDLRVKTRLTEALPRGMQIRLSLRPTLTSGETIHRAFDKMAAAQEL